MIANSSPSRATTINPAARSTRTALTSDGCSLADPRAMMPQ